METQSLKKRGVILLSFCGAILAMRTNWVREKMRAGQSTIGCFMGLGSPNVAELLAHLGFDWLVIETEHTPSTRPRSNTC